MLLKHPAWSDPGRCCSSYTTVGIAPNHCTRKSLRCAGC